MKEIKTNSKRSELCGKKRNEYLKKTVVVKMSQRGFQK